MKSVGAIITQVAEFGDSYHEKGQERAESWADGFAYGLEQYFEATVEILEKRHINDSIY
jgi:hypothetical protein